jgi:hypothetical protein
MTPKSIGSGDLSITIIVICAIPLISEKSLMAVGIY